MLAVAMCVPNMPLQMVFAQQAARALATGRERALAGMIRLAWLGTLGPGAAAHGGHGPLARPNHGGVEIAHARRLVDHPGGGPAVVLAAHVFGADAGTAELSSGSAGSTSSTRWAGFRWRRPWSWCFAGASTADDRRRLRGAGDGGGHRHLADARLVGAARGAFQRARTARADRAADARLRRGAISVHGGHDVCEGLFHRRRIGVLCERGHACRGRCCGWCCRWPR